MTDVKPSPPSNVRLWVLAAGTFLFGTSGFVVAGVLPSIAKSFEIDITRASLLITAYAIVFAIGAPVIAMTTTRIPRTALLAAGLAIGTAGTILATLAPTFDIMIVGRVIAAIGGATFVPAATAAAAAIALPGEQGRAVSLVTAGFTAATALGAPIGTALGALGTWHTSLWFVVVVGVLVLALTVVVLRDVPLPAPQTVRERFAPLGSARIAAVLVATLLLVAGQYSAYTFFGAVQDRATDGSGTVLAILLFVYGASATIGNLAGGRLVDRFGDRRVLNGALLVLVVAFVAMPFAAATLWTAAIAIAIWGMSSWAALLALQVRTVIVSPGAIAWNSSAVFIGIALSAPLGSLAISTVGAHFLTLIVVIVIIAGGLVGEVGFALHRRHLAKAA